MVLPTVSPALATWPARGRARRPATWASFPGIRKTFHPRSDYSLKKAECIAGVIETHMPSVVWGRSKGAGGETGCRGTTGDSGAGSQSPLWLLRPGAPHPQAPRGAPFPHAPWVFVYCRETSYGIPIERALTIRTPTLCRSIGFRTSVKLICRS